MRTVDAALTGANHPSPDQIWRLRLLKSEILLSQSLSRDALTVLTPADQPEPTKPTLTALRSTLRAAAEGNLHQFELAGETFRATEKMPGASDPEVLGELLLGEGRLATSRHDLASAEVLFQRALVVTREHNQPFLATRALGSLGYLQMQQGNYADAADLFSSSLAQARKLDAQAMIEKMAVNLGWAYRRMGDLERADELFHEAEEKSKSLGVISDQAAALMNIATIRFVQHDYAAAGKDYEQALLLARQRDDQQQAAFSLIDLAQTAVEQGNFPLAEKYNAEALALEHLLGNHEEVLYAMVAQARILLARKDAHAALRLLQEVMRNPGTDVTLQAYALSTMALSHTQRNQLAAARMCYEAAVLALEKGRESLGRDELKLSYPANTKNIYDDYIDFLVDQGLTAEAFRVAELRRARTLTEGLGSHPLRSQIFSLAEAEQAASRSGHVVLSYWIGPKRSYVWVLLPGHSKFFVLPGESKIRPLVERYRAHLLGAFDAGSIANPYGEELYRLLIGPVEGLIKPQSNVTIISDGPLCDFNFETLVVPLPTPHYWIEDVSVTNASTAVLLSLGSRLAARRSSNPSKTMLLIGDPRQPESYPALSHAGEEMRLVGSHFSPDQETVLSGAAATPKAYFGARPEDYAFIHFVAHGTASRVSPLDSAVVLSQDGASYNLSARDIANSRLNARLVTISACDSAGNRIYSSEGLVGLSWGFLRAGAQQVIASMWEVNDTSTPQLMDHMYAALAQGEDPAPALRAAKLALLRSGTVHARPFYWAPFLIYQGVRPAMRAG